MYQKYKNIPRLIACRVLEMPMSEEENRCLDEWLQASEENYCLFEQIRDKQLAMHILRLQQAKYGDKMAERFAHRVFGRQRRIRLIRWGSVAAMFVLFFSLSFYFFGEKEKQQIFPGEGGAVLTLADGRQFDIAKVEHNVVDELVTSVSIDVKSDTIPYNTLTVEAGKEVVFRLPDRTRAWINSESELRFPVTFTKGKERKVYLKGEAYFDVTKDQHHPFVVTLDEDAISVYGTRFNVSHYPDEPLSAVLIEGSIGFRPSGGEEVRLHPSERLEYDATTGQISIRAVDVSQYVAWVNHQFVFHGQTLEEIMTTLARWYDFTPVFTSDAIRHIRLSGRLYRYDDIRILLDSYEKTSGLKFKLQGKQIIISE